MGFVVTTILLLFGIYISRKKRTWVSPDVLFCYEWAFISFLASLQLFGMYAVSTKTWVIMLIGSFAFLIGVNVSSKTKVRLHCDTVGASVQTRESSQSNKWFWVIILILYVFAVKDLIQTVRLMLSGVMLDNIRLMSYGIVKSANYQLNTGLVAELISSLVSAVETVIIAIGIQKTIIDANKNYKCLIAVTALVLIRSFSDGGRFGIAYLIVELLACYAFYVRYGQQSKIELTQHLKRRIRWILIALVALIIIITLLRGAESAELLKKYYRYICGNTVFFDLHVLELDASDFWSFGFAGFYGVWAWLLPILHNSVGLPYPETYLNTITNVMNGQMFLKIGTDMYTNAFITPFYQLYADFRWFGVFGGMFLFGFLAGRAFKKAKSFRKYDVVYFLVIVQMIFKTLQMYPFASKDYFMIFVVFLMISIAIRVRVR